MLAFRFFNFVLFLLLTTPLFAAVQVKTIQGNPALVCQPSDSNTNCGGGGGGGGTPGGSDTQVQFKDGSSFGGNAGFIFIKGSGNVGINTANPGQKVDVQGTVRATQFLGPLVGNVTGNADTVTSGVYTTGSYSDPAWITHINYSILDGTVPTWNQNTSGNAATVTNGVYTSRNINTTAPITGGGALSSDLTIACNAASGSQAGCLSSTDWTTFNNKGSGTVTTVTASSPLASSGGATPNITVNSSTGTGAIVLQTSPNLTANVGIGSASPGQTLDVQGTIRSTNLTVTSLTSNYVPKANASKALVNSTIYDDGSIVSAGGTGDISGAKLQSSGSISSNGNYYLSSGSAASVGGLISGNVAGPDLTIQAASGGAGGSVEAGGDLYLRAGNAYAPSSTSAHNGNIYLKPGASSGTSNTMGASYVAGGDATQNTGSQSENGGNVYVYGGPGYSVGANGKVYLGDNGSGSFGSLYSSATHNFTGSPSISATNNVGINANSSLNKLDVGGNAAFGTYGGANTAPTNGLIVSGNVGVGSITPGQILDVQGTARATQFSGPLVGNVTGNADTVTNGVYTTRTLNTTAPITGGGNLSADRTIACNVASGSQAGCLSSADWTTFNGKGSGSVTSVTLATPNSTLTLGGTNPVTTSGTINADLNLGNVNNWTANVGLNSASPGQRLDVQGTVRATAFINRGATSSQFQKGDGSLDSSTYLTGNQTITLSNDVTGSGTTAITASLKNTGTAGTYRSVTFDAQGRETSGTNPTTFSGYGISDSSANLRSSLTDSTGTGVAVFGTSPNLTANVGIGSATPGQALDVQGTVRGTAFVKSGGTSSQFLKGDGSTDSTAYGTGTVTSVTGTSPLTSSGGTTPAISINLSTGSGSVVLQTSPNLTANVGIGSASPGQALDVQGTVRASAFKGIQAADVPTLNQNTTGSAATLTTPRAINGTNFDGSAAITVTAAAGTLTGTTLNSTVVNSSLNTVGNLTANIGIGSASPGQALDVQGTIRSTQIIDSGITASKVVVTDANKQLTAATNLTDTAYSTAVGSNPTGTVGTAAVNGSSTNFMRADGAPAINLTMAPTWTGQHTFNATPIALNTGTGNVGINSATPGQILDVQGTVRSTQMIDTGLTASRPVISDANKQLASGSYSGNTTTFATTTGALTNGNFASWDASGNAVASGTANTAAGIVGLFTSCSGTQYLGADGACHNSGGAASAAGGTNAVQYNSGSSTFAGAENVFSMNGTNVGIGTTNGQALFDVEGQSYHNGNVGIGSLAPQFPLVAQNSTTDEMAAITTSTTSGAALRFLTPSNLLSSIAVFSGSNFSPDVMAFYHNGARRMVIDKNGNVGIGTPAPLTLLAVTGGNVGIGTWTTGASTGGSATLSVLENPNMGILIKGKSGNNSGNADFTIEGASDTGSWDFAVNDGSSGSNVAGYLVFYDNINNKSPFILEPNSPTNSLMIKASGNVGIGSATPGKALDVQGAIRQSTAPTLCSAGSYATGVTGSFNATGCTVAGTGTVNSGTANQAAYYASSTTAVSGTSDLVFVGSNVGINSATPGQILDVQGTIRGTGFALSTGSSSGYTLISNSVGLGTWMAATTQAGSIASLTTTGTSGASTFAGGVLNIPQYTGGTGTNYWQLTNVGIGTGYPGNVTNVGIGTTTYGSTFDVVGNVGIGTNGSSLYVLNAGPSGGLMVEGNVGIGSLTPGQALDVNGAGRFLGSGDTLLNQTSGNVGIATITTNGTFNVDGNVGIGTNNPFLMTAPPIGGMFVQGNVGIGTTTPSQALYVVGRVFATTGMNIGIGTAQQARLCITSANQVIACN